MDPISAVIDKTEDLLGHSPHPAIVMLPLGAWACSNLADGLALATGDERYDDSARLTLGIGLAGAAVAAATGLRDYSKIPKERPSHEVATQHALANAVAGTLMATSFFLRTRDEVAGRRTSLAARLLAMAGGSLSFYSAWLGGVLVENLGEAVKPVMDRLSAQESHDENDHGRERLDPESPLGRRHPHSATL